MTSLTRLHKSECHSWDAMIQRCTNTKSRAYSYYGGRGISVCARWRVFANFFADMGLKPSPKHSIDRINNNGNYEPGNCRWAVRRTQQRNMRSNRALTFNGQTKFLCEWEEETGISQKVIWQRVSVLGWPADRALTEPVNVPGDSSLCYRCGAKKLTRTTSHCRPCGAAYERERKARLKATTRKITFAEMRVVRVTYVGSPTVFQF